MRRLTMPVSGSISAISDNGRMVVCPGNSGRLNCDVLVAKP